MIAKSAALFLILFVPIYCFTQTQELELMVPEWVQKDVDGVKFVMRLTPIENHKIAEIEKLLADFQKKNADWSNKTSLGFGAERIKLSMGLGYTTIYIDYLVFKGRIVHYTIGADVSSEDWSRHGPTVMQAWKDGGGPDFEVKGSELTSEKDFPEVWSDYYSEIGRELGAVKTISVPDKLSEHYKLLTNPFRNSRISYVACDEGKPAIDALEDAKRVDLIENVLRSYNPGGRIYAAISLLRMQRKGRHLTVQTKQAISKVVKSDASVTTCWGDTGVAGLTARDVVPEYVKSKDWYRLRTWK